MPDVKWPDILQLYHELRHIPYQANRTYGVLSSMFTFAEDRGLLPPPGAKPFSRKFQARFREKHTESAT